MSAGEVYMNMANYRLSIRLVSSRKCIAHTVLLPPNLLAIIVALENWKTFFYINLNEAARSS